MEKIDFCDASTYSQLFNCFYYSILFCLYGKEGEISEKIIQFYFLILKFFFSIFILYLVLTRIFNFGFKVDFYRKIKTKNK